MHSGKILSSRRACMVALVFACGLLCVSSVASALEAVRDGGLALCVGINNYTRLEPLHAPARDAAVVGTALRDTGGFRRVLVLSDTDASGPRSKATRANIVDTLTLLSNNATREDALVFFFSGYGLSHEGKTYLMPIDAEPVEVIDPDAGIPMDDILAIMKKSRASGKLILIDANNDGELFPGIAGPIETPGDDFTIIVSCAEGQYTIVDEGRSMGLFAMGVEAALAGESDADADGALSGMEILNFLDAYMSNYCLDNLAGAGQSPQMSTGDPMMAMIYNQAFSGMARRDQPDAVAADVAVAPASPDVPEEGVEAPEEILADGGADAVAESPVDGEAEISDAELERRLADATAEMRIQGKQEAAFAAFMDLTGYGMAEAEFQVGQSYYFGVGAAQDYKKAEQWFIRAGDLGHAKAQEMLAQMYWLGTGVPQDGQKAGKWSVLQGRIPADASPIVDKRRNGRAYASAKPAVVAPAEPVRPEVVAVTPATTPQPSAAPQLTYEQQVQQYQRQYQQYPQQYQQRQQYGQQPQQQYQQNDPNSFGMKARRFILGW